MVLLELVLQAVGEARSRILVAHFNHCLRGRESDRDQQLVKRVCDRHRIACFTNSGNVRGYAREHGVSIEMAARSLRYAFLKDIAQSERCAVVVTAHHADDQVELFLMRWCRGAGGDGLSGMERWRPFPGLKAVRLYRPLLSWTKKELIAWARLHRVKYREDASNANDDHLRNRVRHRVVPVLAETFGATFAEGILRSSEIIRAESECVEAAAKAWLRRSRRKPFDSLDCALQRQVLRLQLLESGVSPTFVSIEFLRTHPESWTAIAGSPKKTYSRTSTGVLKERALSSGASAAFRRDVAEVSLGDSGNCTLGDVQVSWEHRDSVDPKWARQSKPQTEIFDALSLGNRIRLRFWRPGDRFQPLGFPGTTKLQDLFVNQKVAPSMRKRLLVGESESGDLFWVEGLPPGERFKWRQSSSKVLIWKWRR